MSGPVVSRPALAAWTLLPGPILGAGDLAWALLRIHETGHYLLLVWEMVFSVSAGLAAGLAVFRLTRGNLKGLGALRWPLVIGAAGLVTFGLIGLHSMVDYLSLVSAFVVPLAMGVVFFWLLVTRLGGWVWPALLAVLYGLLSHLLGSVYAWLNFVLAVSTLGAGILAARRLLDERLGENRASIFKWAVALSLITMAAAGAERLITDHASSFRGRNNGSGMFTAMVVSAQKITDVDNDGYGNLFGQRDCSLFDSAINTGAHEKPGNERDDNCLAGSAEGSILVRLHETAGRNAPPDSLDSDVVVVVLDALRYDDSLAPELETLRALRKNGRTFQNAYSTSSLTIQSLAGVLAARLASTVPYRFLSSVDAVPAKTVPTLFTWLAAEGFDTGLVGGIVERPDGSGIFGGQGYGKDARVRKLLSLGATAPETTDAAIEVWPRLNPKKRRLLYVHYMAIHEHTEDREVYRRLVKETDRELGRLRDAIGEDPLWVILADHGQSFGSHGSFGHSFGLYEEITHVPLIFSHPNIERGSEKRVTTL
ncbi:MAG: sulfatase-like hydrolase/transferase, partial [Deltaproteobacteria bacterium]|nr:sulfatase-like hydrolase/transferase [Deltaproteobacteria bacterium]